MPVTCTTGPQITVTPAGQGKRQAAKKRGAQAEEAAEAAVDERERRNSEAVLAFAGRVLDTLDTDVRFADSAATLRLEGLLADLQAAVDVRPPNVPPTPLWHILVLGRRAVVCVYVCLCVCVCMCEIAGGQQRRHVCLVVVHQCISEICTCGCRSGGRPGVEGTLGRTPTVYTSLLPANNYMINSGQFLQYALAQLRSCTTGSRHLSCMCRATGWWHAWQAASAYPHAVAVRPSCTRSTLQQCMTTSARQPQEASRHRAVL